MNAGNLDTTNLLLGIMAAASVIETLLLVGLGVMGYRLYVQAMQTAREVEARQIAPLVARANGLMLRANAILNTFDRADEPAHGRSRSSRMSQFLTLVHTARAAVDGFLHQSRRA
jgi:hypothetical protein